jgi:glycosyltransferase involved in cell wall biosynthesis
MSSTPSTVAPEFTVIIPAFNEAANIARCLSALEAQTLPADRFEVVVVDNGSTDATVAEASRFLSRLQLQVLVKPGCNISAVRNHGAAVARGRILSFLDADCITTPNWLEQSLSFAAPHTIWGAHYLVPLDSTWVGTIWFQYQATEYDGPVSFIPASNLFIFRDDFEKIGGFGESLQTSEDVELCLRARRNGMNIVAHRSLAVYHEGTPRTLRHFYRQNRWHGINTIRIFIENLPSTKSLPLVALSFYMFVMFWLVIATPLLIVFHHDWLAAIFIILLLLPAALLSSWKTLRSGKPRAMPQLSLLYLTYLLARAASLTRLSGRTHR